MAELNRLYTIHLKEVGGERIMEWRGETDSDAKARALALTAAAKQFYRGGIILRTHMDTVVDNDTNKRNRNLGNTSLSKVKVDPDVPAILQRTGKKERPPISQGKEYYIKPAAQDDVPEEFSDCVKHVREERYNYL